ncbi:hypothetical protein Pat9b_4669 (plasmid) [Pantoea sp. At-9b]|nr:hypothetical protein Pat9b_4669 [Pantoea sp. At-9b]
MRDLLELIADFFIYWPTGKKGKTLKKKRSSDLQYRPVCKIVQTELTRENVKTRGETSKN